MSYGFTVKAKTKREAISKMRIAFAAVITSQPVHNADIPHQTAAAECMVHAMRDPRADEAIKVDVNGSCSTPNYLTPGYERTPAGTPDEGELGHANFGITVQFVKHEITDPHTHGGLNDPGVSHHPV